MVNEKLKAAIPEIVKEMDRIGRDGCQCPEPQRLFPTGFCRDCGLLSVSASSPPEGVASDRRNEVSDTPKQERCPDPECHGGRIKNFDGLGSYKCQNAWHSIPVEARQANFVSEVHPPPVAIHTDKVTNEERLLAEDMIHHYFRHLKEFGPAIRLAAKAAICEALREQRRAFERKEEHGARTSSVGGDIGTDVCGASPLAIPDEPSQAVSAPGEAMMRYLIIAYDKTSVTVNRLTEGQQPPTSLLVQDVLCQGSSFGDVVKALEQAFGEEMAAK